jgi:soluble lytic murein transglycosylase
LLAAADQTSQFTNFFGATVHNLETTEQRVALVRLAQAYGATQVALRTAKISARLGDDLGHFAYPRDVLPDYTAPRGEVEAAFVHGVIRQESEFNAEAISHAGARGLMQIMPGTAKMLARAHGISYSRDNLTKRPTYNLTLGTALLSDLLGDFNGSFIMTIAAYNAGPGRIPQWTGRYGDPRTGEVEPVDFIESIPFNETRNYVKRVMENIQVYRTLFGATPVPLGEDLSRGGDAVFDTAGSIECDAPSQASIEQLIACN